MADATTETPQGTEESFAALLDESLGHSTSLEGKVLKGTIVAIDGDAAVIDVGLKSDLKVGVESEC